MTRVLRTPGPRVTTIVTLAALLALSSGAGEIALGSLHTTDRGFVSSAGLQPFAASISLSPKSGPPGTTISISGSGFTCGSVKCTLSITFAGTTITTSPSPCGVSGGSFTCSITAPKGYPGSDTVGASYGGLSASAIFNETFDLTVDPTSVDVGQNVTLVGMGFGNSTSMSTLEVGADPVSCTAATVGTCSSGSVTTNSSGDFNITFVAPSVTASATYVINATDSGGTTKFVNLTVDLDPTASQISASMGSADLGQTVEFNVTAELGSGSFGYAWSGLPGCSGTSDPLPCSVNSTGQSMIRVAVTDSNHFTVQGGPIAFTSFPDPTVATPTVSDALVDVGQNITFATSAGSGTGVYVSYAWTGLPAGCTGNGPNVTCVPQAPASGSASVSVTDSNGATSAVSAGVAYTIFAALNVPVPSANRSSADVGQPVRFSGSVTLGSSGYTYAWTGLPGGCRSADSPNLNCTASASGSYSIRLIATDSIGDTGNSSALIFQIYADPIPTVAAARTAVDVDQSVQFNATSSGGSGGITYAWTGLPSGCPNTGAGVHCKVSAPGNYPVTVRVQDSNGMSVASDPLLLVVASALTASIPVFENVPAVGEKVTFNSTATGGTGDRSFAWAFGDGTRATGATVSHSYSAPGLYTIDLWVNDSVGGSVHKTTEVTIVAASPSPTLLGLPEVEGIGVLAAVGIIVVAVAIGAILHGRSGRPPSSPPPEEGVGGSSDGSLPYDPGAGEEGVEDTKNIADGAARGQASD